MSADTSKCCGSKLNFRKSMFKKMEDGLINQQVATQASGQYVPLNLATEWEKWMNGQAQLAKSKGENFVKVRMTIPLSIALQEC